MIDTLLVSHRFGIFRYLDFLQDISRLALIVKQYPLVTFPKFCNLFLNHTNPFKSFQ